MKKIILLIVLVTIIGFTVYFVGQPKQSDFEYSVVVGELSKPNITTSNLYDIKDVVKTFEVTKSKQVIGKAIVTERQFPNGDLLTFVEFHSPEVANTFIMNIGKQSDIKKEEMIDTPVTELYPYRKARKIQDPLSTRLDYLETKHNSFLISSQVMFKDISYTYKGTNKTSTVYQFLKESHDHKMTEDGFTIKIQAENSYASTWVMTSSERLFETKDQFVDAHKIGADEYRWMLPNMTLSHGLSSIYPEHPDAFVRSLVRQSGRSSSIALEKESSRFNENINRHQLKSLEDARNSDGVWHSNYTSTWLEKAYGFGPDYVDSRHNDNIFRSQLRRADLLGYKEYAKNIEVYADFLIEMAKKDYTIPTESGFYLIDYYDLTNKSLTHVSLNHALSLMNYLYYAYLETGKEKYLETANFMYAALKDTGEDWINASNAVNYQLNLDGSFSGKDYNLVTYYDLIYAKKLLGEVGIPSAPIIDELIDVKKRNLIERNIEIEEDIEVIEDIIGLIE